MKNIESGVERNHQGLVISDVEMDELKENGQLTITLYPRSFSNVNPEIKIGQTINLSAGGRPDMVDFNPDAQAKVTSIEPAEKNSQGDEQIRISLELIK